MSFDPSGKHIKERDADLRRELEMDELVVGGEHYGQLGSAVLNIREIEAIPSPMETEKFSPSAWLRRT